MSDKLSWWLGDSAIACEYCEFSSLTIFLKFDNLTCKAIISPMGKLTNEIQVLWNEFLEI